jgi:outer membrane protein TolC
MSTGFFRVCAVFFIFASLPVRAQDLVFHNPREAVNFALQNSQVYLLQQQRVLQSMKEAKFGIQDFLPTFGFTLSENDNTTLLAGDSRTKSFQATVSQEIFDGGKKKLAYDINRLGSMYAYNDYKTALLNFSSDIIDLYYRFLMQRHMVLIKEELAGAAKDQLDIMQKEVAIGITLETDYLEYLISYIQIENDRDQGKKDLATLERRFKIAIDLHDGAVLEIRDDFYHNFSYFFYEPYAEFLWVLIKTASTEIKKQDLALEYARKQLVYSRRWYVPTVSAQGGVSFTGDAYPLTEPKYSFRLIFDFTNAGLFPLSVNSGYGFDRERLYSVTNSASVDLEPNPAYGVRRKLADISLLETSLQRLQTEKEIRESLLELINAHDNSLRAADAAQRTIAVLERRLEFSRHSVEQGEMTRIDYLEELSKMAQTRVALLQYQAQAYAQERSLEILAGFSFGDLQNVCENQK